MKKRVLATLLAMSMVLGLAACGSKSDSKDDKKEETKTEAKADAAEDVELQVFIAASLSKVMDEVATEYQKDHPNVNRARDAEGPRPQSALALLAVQSVLYPDAGRGAAEPDGGASPCPTSWSTSSPAGAAPMPTWAWPCL